MLGLGIVLSLFVDLSASHACAYAKSQPSLMWCCIQMIKFPRLFWITTMIADASILLICNYFYTFCFVFIRPQLSIADARGKTSYRVYLFDFYI